MSLSVLDPSPIIEGGSAKEALDCTLDLAKKVEALGFKRFWLAEHHNWPGMASSASSLIIGRVASVTNSIRVGSAATLLSHYSALSVAEQFGVLASYFPDRIDLGLGRAPGTDRNTASLLNNRQTANSPQYIDKVKELYSYLHQSGTTTSDGMFEFHAIPGENTKVPIWLHGSGTYSAQLAGQLGLPFTFAGHFAPDNMMQALKTYRDNFQPSNTLDKPYCLVAVSVIAADTMEEASKLASSLYLKYLLVDRGTPMPLKPPMSMDELWDKGWNRYERASAESQLYETIIGDRLTVKKGFEDLISRTSADEILVQAEIYDHNSRIKSYEILSELFQLKKLSN
ncbi:LLM class flavin-dependent oxidoreductase [Metabacillus litoralis]|uniref:LLM class flavin-dependent oxidoreductase n=1 Tax=Metabacillus litoralis TaxID=152268 RepID=UPI00203D3C38|nr:LLM class flavin-dependent oxidoreductase [Metabacillus litoralis]MCM3653445.1 LLM class flavin-dependent oxidoreductase [Metabacillus litoralis]